MANPFKTFLNALIGKDTGTANPEEIKEAEQKGEIVATNAAKKLGFVEQVEIDADEARRAAEANVKEKTIKEGREKE
ncbi:MAG: hypothetical protein ACI4VP_00715 [Clostridia bacterium]